MDGIAALRQAVATADNLPLNHAVAAILPFLSNIDWLRADAGAALAKLRVHPMYLPPLRAAVDGPRRIIVLAKASRISVTVAPLDIAKPVEAEQGAVVVFGGHHGIIRPVGAGMVAVQMFVRDDNDNVRSGAICHLTCDSLLTLDESRETCRIVSVEGPVALLRAQILPPVPPITHVHDITTGAQVARSSRDEIGARTLMLLSLLRTMGRRDAAPLFLDASRADAPHQRWAVLREGIALDTAAMLPRLAEMAVSDPDPELRALAGRTASQAKELIPCHA